MSGGIHANVGNYGLGIAQLQECLIEADEHVLIHVVVQLMAAYLRIGELESIKKLIELESKILEIRMVTPFKKAELATYFKLQGDYNISMGKINDGLDCYVKSVLEYGKVSAHTKGYECLNIIMNCYVEHKDEVEGNLFGELGKVYNLLSST